VTTAAAPASAFPAARIPAALPAEPATTPAPPAPGLEVAAVARRRMVIAVVAASGGAIAFRSRVRAGIAAAKD
jgi:hypothetical protein